MRAWRSDPVLIRPEPYEFLPKWNENNDSLLDSSRHLRYQLTERLKNEIPSNLPLNEQYRYERKLEKKIQREQTLFLANTKDYFEECLRYSSLPELSLMPSNLALKRVSFLFKEECPLWYHENKRLRARKPTCYSLKPILVRKPRSPSLPLSHMDFESFNAWRRGSQVSEELYQSSLSSKKAKKKLKEAENKDLWDVACSFIKSIFFRCRSKNSTQPQEVIYSIDYKI